MKSLESMMSGKTSSGDSSEAGSAKDVMSAIKSGDEKAFGTALKAYVLKCMADAEEGEDEGDEAEEVY